MGMALIVHGGAGDVADAELEHRVRGVRAAARAGWDVLLKGGSAADAVEAAVVIMEDDPAFDAGYGSVLNRDGEVEMDAGFMDGSTLDAGAVAGVRRVKNPIRLARHVMTSEVTMLIGQGAERFAQEVGISLVENIQMRSPEQVAKWQGFLANPPDPIKARFMSPQGTVGCVAVDRNGSLAAGTSTGGMQFKRVGRVGDSPLIGAGVYADGLRGGASATGWGEAITRVVLSKYAVDALEGNRDPNAAARMAIEQLSQRVGGTGGIILADSQGRIGFFYNTKGMARAFITEGMGDITAAY